jgi:2-dehydro-3-deoxyphosphogluconate aldolase/(4S)-4-hydroxy-2-oxoglutarate aldolase
MNRDEKLELIRGTGVIAIMRAKSSDQLIAAADAIRRGGVRAIEVTMTTPGRRRHRGSRSPLRF